MLLLTEVFVGIARRSAAKLGIAEPRLAVIEHPLGGLVPDAVRARASAAVEAVVAALAIEKLSINEAVDRDPSDVEAAIAELRKGLNADGADLIVESVDPLIVVRLSLGDGAAPDCLVAPNVLRGIVEDVLTRVPAGRDIAFIDPRDP